MDPLFVVAFSDIDEVVNLFFKDLIVISSRSMTQIGFVLDHLLSVKKKK
jgi:hypothetical protein